MRRAIILTIAIAGIGAGPAPGGQEAAQTSRGLVRLDPVAPEIPRGYALIVGVGDHEKLGASMQLQFAESDAEAMYRVLISHEGGAFPAENVKLLKGRDATLASIRQALEEWLPAVAGPQDRVVVYYAGHGLVKNGKCYLAAYDTDPERLEETSYPMDALGDVLANDVKARWKVLLTDACHTGRINAETTNEALERQFDALPSSFLTLTASAASEQSFEDPKLSTGFGVFTYFVVQAFRGYADGPPCDGRITADELIGYVESNVRSYARERRLLQTPKARGDYEPAMLLGMTKTCPAETAKATSMLGTAIIEANLDGVIVYIDGNLIGPVSPGKALIVPGLPGGLHEFQGVKEGYEPDRKQIMIFPGQDATVTLRIRYARQIRKSASQLNEQGEKLLFTRRSSLSLSNLIPVERKQTEEDLKRAAALFEKALRDDPTYALAAYHLGQVQQLLLNHEQSLKHFNHAIAIDPSYVDARLQRAGVLIELGDADEAIRELMEVLRLEPSNDQAFSRLSSAYWNKNAWSQAIEQADRALSINPSNADAHLWKADSLRWLAVGERDAGRQRQLFSDAREGYHEFLKATNFSSSLVARLGFYGLGFGLGGRKHADRQGAYDSQRGAAFLGLCQAEHRLGNLLRARGYCQRALEHLPDEAVAHYILGNVNRDLFLNRNSCEHLLAARVSYQRMIQINPDLEETKKFAKPYLASIDEFLPTSGCRT